VNDEERDKIEREQGEAMLRAIHAQRAAEHERRLALSEAIQRGLADREEERRQREEGGSGP
jgi:Spy/CpxP family protein refolding chaperone